MKRGEQDFTHKYIHREVYEKLKVAEKKWWVDRGALGFTKWMYPRAKRARQIHSPALPRES